MHDSGRLQPGSADTPVNHTGPHDGRSDATKAASVRLDFRNTPYWTDGHGRHICPGCHWRRRINDGTRRVGVNGRDSTKTDSVSGQSAGF